MSLIKIIVQGVHSANKNGKILIYLWLINFLFSLVVLAPFYFLLSSQLSRSLTGYNLLHGIDFLWLGDLIHKYQAFLPTLLGGMIIPVLLYLCLSTFLNGGIIGRLILREEKGEKTSLASFLSDCARFFFRFFKVFLISLAAYVVVFGLIGKGISAALELWTSKASTEWPSIISSNLKILIFVLLFSIVQMFFDFVRLRLVLEESKKTLRATLATSTFIGKNFFRAWFLYVMVGVFFILGSLAFLIIGRVLPELSPVFLLILFIWQQLYLLFRMWTKVLFFSTEYQFLKTR